MQNLMMYAPRQPRERVLPAILGTGAAREEELRQKAIGVARRLNLLRVADNAAADLSGGQKKLLEIGRALMAEPRMIMLDEPIAGVNPTLSEEIAEAIRGLRDDGLTFLIIEHNMDLIARLCRHVFVLAAGRMLFEGTPKAAIQDTHVIEAYLGTGTL